jgi:hypothetical protein
MDNRYQMIYENANLENLERQIQSGYLTEASLKSILSHRELSDAEKRLIILHKPDFAKIIEEAAPVEVDSRFKTWVMGKAPIASWNATAQGRQAYAQQSNTLKNEYLRYIASIGKKINNSTAQDLASFLQRKGYNTSNSNILTTMLQRPTDIISEQDVNEIIRNIISTNNMAPVLSQQSSMDPAKVNALAAVLNKTTGKNNWGYANTVGLIKRLKQAGVNISI